MFHWYKCESIFAFLFRFGVNCWSESPHTLLKFTLQRCLGVHKLHFFWVKLNWEMCSRRPRNVIQPPRDEWTMTPGWNIFDINPFKRYLWLALHSQHQLFWFENLFLLGLTNCRYSNSLKSCLTESEILVQTSSLETVEGSHEWI